MPRWGNLLVLHLSYFLNLAPDKHTLTFRQYGISKMHDAEYINTEYFNQNEENTPR